MIDFINDLIIAIQEEVCDQSRVEKVCVTVSKNSYPAWSKTCNIPEPIKEEIHNEVLSQTSNEGVENEVTKGPSDSFDKQRSKIVRFKVPYVISTSTQKSPTTLSTITQRTRVNFNFTPRNFTSIRNILPRPKHHVNQPVKEAEANITAKPTGVPYVYADRTTKK